MSSVSRCPRNHQVRRGVKGDRSTGMLAAKDTTPFYVLLCDDKQVGAVDATCIEHIAILKIFEEYQGVGHSEIFLELLETEARKQGVGRIENVTPTDNPNMIRAFERCGFALKKKESNGDCWYYKDL